MSGSGNESRSIRVQLGHHGPVNWIHKSRLAGLALPRGPRHNRRATRSVRAPRPPAEPGLIAAQNDPATMRQTGSDTMTMVARWVEVSSSISLVRRRTRVVGIEGAQQNAAHSIRGDATRQARAGQTLGVESGRRFQDFTSAPAMRPLHEKGDGRVSGRVVTIRTAPNRRRDRSDVNPEWFPTASGDSRTGAAASVSRSSGRAQGQRRLQQFAQQGDLAELARRGEHRAADRVLVRVGWDLVVVA